MKAPFLNGASILVIGECVQTTFPRSLQTFTQDQVMLTCCPEAEGFNGLTEKLAMIVRCSNPKDITVLTVDGSPHCTMLHASLSGARLLTGTEVPVRHFVIVREGEGEVKEVSPESVRVGRYLHLVEKCVQKCPEIIRDLEHLSLEQRSVKKGASAFSH